MQPCNVALDYEGMSLRDYFAGKAMEGLLANPRETEMQDVCGIVKSAYETADAMLAQREES